MSFANHIYSFSPNRSLLKLFVNYVWFDVHPTVSCLPTQSVVNDLLQNLRLHPLLGTVGLETSCVHSPILLSYSVLFLSGLFKVFLIDVYHRTWMATHSRNYFRIFNSKLIPLLNLASSLPKTLKPILTTERYRKYKERYGRHKDFLILHFRF